MVSEASKATKRGERELVTYFVIQLKLTSGKINERRKTFLSISVFFLYICTYYDALAGVLPSKFKKPPDRESIASQCMDIHRNPRISKWISIKAWIIED